jgi:peptidoglycan/xylan/chitin deacetylase (PgdA/CDA1 family)
VLLYHRIAVDPRDPFAVSPSLFADHVALIAGSGCSAITIGELADGLRGARRLPPHPVAVTFDDGFACTPSAVATLARNALRATVYVTAGAIDRPGALRRDQLVGLAARDDVIQLGAHSVTHPHLDALPHRLMRAEVTASKSLLEQLIDGPLDTFAYPYGSYDAHVRRAVVAAGFRSAAAVKNAISHRDDDPWALARYTVTNADDPSHLEAVLNGHGAPRAWRGQRVRTRAVRAARRARGRVGGQSR